MATLVTLLCGSGFGGPIGAPATAAAPEVGVALGGRTCGEGHGGRRGAVGETSRGGHGLD